MTEGTNGTKMSLFTTFQVLALDIVAMLARAACLLLGMYYIWLKTHFFLAFGYYHVPPPPMMPKPMSIGVSGNLKMGACSRTHVRSDALAAGKLCTICSSPIPPLYNMVKPNTIIVQYAAQYHHAPQTCDKLRLVSQYHTNPPHPTHSVPSHPPML